jgi:mannosyltransferase OCH1-like enzyme
VNLPLATDLKIPHIIHQTWKENQLPNTIVEYMKSWHKHHPSWQYMFWTDDDILRFVQIRYPQFIPTFTGYEMAIMKADVFRYLVLNDIGGLYADLDFESLQPIDNFTSNHTCIISQEPLEHAHLLYDVGRFCSNAVMAAAPGHPFFRWLIGELPKIAMENRQRDVQHKTGPAMLEKAVQNYTRLFLNGSFPKGHELYVASQEELMPEFDMKQRYEFTKTCSRKSKYQGVKKRICEDLHKTNFQNRPLANAFSNHHWIHFWGPTFKSGFGQVTNIDVIAPYRVNVTNHVLNMAARKDQS